MTLAHWRYSGSPDGRESASMIRNRRPGHCSDGLQAQLGTVPIVFDASMDGRILQTGHNVKGQEPGNLTRLTLHPPLTEMVEWRCMRLPAASYKVFGEGE
jgi:hypothetical protein